MIKNRLVYMDRAFGFSSCARREVDQGRVFGLRPHGLEIGRSIVEHRTKRHASFGRVIADNQDQLQRWNLVPPCRDLAFIERFCRDQHIRVTDLHPGANGLGTEGGKQRCKHHPGLQRAKGGGIQFGPSAHRDEHARAFCQPVGV